MKGKYKKLLSLFAILIIVSVIFTGCSDIRGNIDYSNDASIVNKALGVFTYNIQNRLKEIPILECSDIYTAKAQTVDYVSYPDVKILVNTNWDVGGYYIEKFRLELLIHEFLHIAQAESNINILQFYNDVQVWYNDKTTGDCNDGIYPKCNYVKYILYYRIYSPSGQNYYAKESDRYGIEEFAYIGVQIIDGDGWLLPQNIIAYYKGIIADYYLGTANYGSQYISETL